MRESCIVHLIEFASCRSSKFDPYVIDVRTNALVKAIPGVPGIIRTSTHWLTTRQTSALFSARTCFASLHSDAVKPPFVSANLRRKGTKSADFFSHICEAAARNACSGAAAVIGAALGQVNDFASCSCAGFRSRRFVCFLAL
jgi:hypothetical protein